jgi:hypothetical protein
VQLQFFVSNLLQTTTWCRLSNQGGAHTSPGHRLQIEIIDPKPSTEYWYSVTVTSHNKYTGTAVYVGPKTEQSGNDTKALLYYWKPPFRGDYEVIIHELRKFNLMRMDTTPTTLLQTFAVSVEDRQSFDSHQDYKHRLEALPSCSRNPRPGMYTQWNGDWIGPDLSRSYDANAASLRTGWTFVPGKEMDCKLDYFTDADLSAIPSPKSIYILGTSRERGVFLSLVDMMLHLDEKRHLGKSVISKCWGRAIVAKGNLRVMYQDWRSHYFEQTKGVFSPQQQPNFVCHDKKVVRLGGWTLVNNGFRVWNEIFQNRSNWPSVILMGTGETPEGFDGEYDLHRFIHELPKDWEGTLFLTDGSFSALDAGRGTLREYQNYTSKLMSLTIGMFDRRVQWLDAKGISKEMRMHTEYGPSQVTKSQHFHSGCNLPYGNGSNDTDKRMLICSNVTEMVAQLMLNHALGPKEHFVKNAIQPSHDSEMQYCHACPASLLPFHITPYPDMTCEKGALHEYMQNETARSTVPQVCPDDCLNSVNNGILIPTQSGLVNERTCPMNVSASLMEGEQAEAALVAQKEGRLQSSLMEGQQEQATVVALLGLGVLMAVVLWSSCRQGSRRSKGLQSFAILLACLGFYGLDYLLIRKASMAQAI